MKKLENHSRKLNVLIEREPQLRCLQHMLELEGIDTSKIDNIFETNKTTIVKICIDVYLEDMSQFLRKDKVYSKFNLNYSHIKEKDEEYVDVKYIKHILDNADIIFDIPKEG